MLATEPAQGPFGHSNMIHTRGHANPQPYPSTGKPVQTKQMAPPANPVQIESPQRDDNIMNRRADINSSLYQICLSLRIRLAEVPGFAPYITEMEEEDVHIQGMSDPVTSMWNCLRRGFPLMTIYNALQPAVPLKVDTTKIAESKLGKAATFKFLQACMVEQKFAPNECFLITDLYGGDTTGFVKVTKVVNRVLDILSQRGLLLKTEHKPLEDAGDIKPQNLSHRQNIVKEIVMTERDYVQHLETLQQFKNEIEESGAIAGDAVHDIFLNLNALLDFQRRFLIRIEQQNSLPESQQNWGQLFIHYKDSFRVYEPFIANHARCYDTILNQWEKLKAASLSPNLNGLLDSLHVLDAFLLKPFQRLSKYPLLLETLRSKGDLDEERKADLAEGSEAAQAILHRANEAVSKEQRLAAVAELQNRVEDWKGHKIDHFGELLLNGNFTVLKGEGAREVEREDLQEDPKFALENMRKKESQVSHIKPHESSGEANGDQPSSQQYKVYLFQRILLCCKEINPNKPKNKMLGANKPLTDKKGKLRLQLKGRIFMQNVTDVLSVKNDKPLYTIQIFWKGDPGVENFVIRFTTEDMMIQWRDQVMMQKQELSNHGRSVGQSVVSDIKFTSMEGQSSLVNPYIHEDDAEEDDSQGSTLVGGQDSFAKSRNASNNSLRTAATLARATILPPDHNISSRQMQTDPNSGLSAQPGLTLHTNLAPIDSAGEFAQSYFSPLADSPGSTRSSTQAYGYAFPQQPTPNNGWRYDENKHKTAPAMGRAPSREMVGPPGSSFSINGRAMQSPSAAAIQNAQYAAMAQSRSRSASTPDIHNAASSGPRRYANGQIQPSIENMPVPPLPSPHIAQMRIPISRSHTNTPTAGQLPIRSATQSPQMSLGRMPRPLPSQHEYDQQHQARQQPANIEPRSHFQNTPLGISLPVPKPSQLGSQQIQAAHLTRVAQRSLPTQLKVKTWYEPASLYVTIVVPINIKYQSVADRIDSKMSKISKASIASGTAKLRYRDESDLVNIESDEELAMAIDTWAELHEGPLLESKCPDFELFWHETTAR